MGLLAAFLGIDPAVLQLLTALLGLIAGTLTVVTTVLGILNRRIRLRTEAAATSLVALLTTQRAEQKAEHDALWTAYLKKDAVANPEGVRRIATETAAELTERELLPMRQFFAATEIVESRRTHSPDTDVIRVLQEITA